ncbi:MAG: hypothetical protein H8E94_01255 [Alphaproteobacteria bacterium]|nr:hypothetical protein [Alphaproteobacteria bacterium]
MENHVRWLVDVPDGWVLQFAGDVAVIAVNPESPPKFCLLDDLPKSFGQWEDFL